MAGSKHRKKKGHKDQKVSKFKPGTTVWYDSGADGVGWLQGSFMVETTDQYQIRTSNRELVSVPNSTPIYEVDTDGLQRTKNLTDLVTLKPPNECNILAALESRSTKYDLPYTFVGPVLLSVNPIQEVKEPKKGADVLPHPNRIAEAALKQMKFAQMVKQPLDQSIIVSGESGAGKTEASKRVLKCLVTGKGAVSTDVKKGAKSLDERLIDTNPILEAFGNATTLRNRNSSRFGKFMKLNVVKGSSGINGAQVETYLLERSRVSGFVTGECNYHVFYQLLGGVKKHAPKIASKLKLDVGGSDGKNFLYLQTITDRGANMGSVDADVSSRPDKRDAADFAKLTKAFTDVGVDSKQQIEMFKIVAGILNLGNVRITDGKEGAEVDKGKSGDALDAAAEQFGVKAAELSKVICEQEMKVMGEIVPTRLNVNDARQSRDAIAKQMYSYIFDYIVKAINKDLKPAKTSKKDAFIGVLDIFGFETFQYNDLEQLLINYTNEALHGIFLQKVFDAELSLYRQEGLVPDDMDSEITVPDNQNTLGLLNGVADPKQDGVLDIIVQQGKIPGATDQKLVKELHSRFANVAHFPRPHPKDVDHMFKVKHFPGVVNYHIGNFLSKNHDRLPNLVESLFQSSKMKVVQDMWTKEEEEDAKENKPGRAQSASSIVHKFKGQIQALSETLNNSQCSFIRCIKPNEFLERNEGSNDWFHAEYVSKQLTSLGIEPTVQVLSRGMPNRIGYAELISTYKDLLPKTSVKMWKRLGGGDRLFVGALFWCFGIDPSQYKLGFSYAFFKAGDLEALETVLKSSAKGLSKKKAEAIDKKFRWFLIRAKWRKATALVLVTLRFGKILKKIQEKQLKMQSKAAVAIQKYCRGVLARVKYEKLLEEKQEKALRKLDEERKKKEKARLKKEKAAEKAKEKQKAYGNVRGGANNESFQRTLDIVREEELSAAEVKMSDKEIKRLEKIKKKLEAEGKKLQEKVNANAELLEQKRFEDSEEAFDEGAWMMAQAMKMKKSGKILSDKELDKMLQKRKEASLAKREQEKNGRQLDEINEKIKSSKKARKEQEQRNKKLKKERKEQVAKLKRMSVGADANMLMETLEATKEAAAAEADDKIASSDELFALEEAEKAEERTRAAIRKANQRGIQRSARVTNLFNVRQAGQVNGLESLIGVARTPGERTFFALKRARKSGRNWKRRFFVLSKSEKLISYYKGEKNGKGKNLKKSYKLSRNTKVVPHADYEGKTYVVKLTDPESNDLYLSFDSPQDQYGFIEDMKTVDYSMRGEARGKLDKGKKKSSRMSMKRVMSMKFKREGSTDLETDMNELQRNLEFEKLLQRLNNLLQEGVITLEEYDKMIDDETTKHMQPAPSVVSTDGSDTESTEEATVILNCQSCGTTNTSEQLKCRKCGVMLDNVENE